MSKADEMFEKLEYEKTQSIKYIGYTNKKADLILFNLVEQTLCIHKDNTEFPATSLPELRAINEKCREMGWLE